MRIDAQKIVKAEELDLKNYAKFKERVKRRIERSKPDDTDVIINLKGIKRVDSSALGILLGLERICFEKGKKIKIENLEKRVEVMFGLVGVNEISVAIEEGGGKARGILRVEKMLFVLRVAFCIDVRHAVCHVRRLPVRDRVLPVSGDEDTRSIAQG